MHKQLIEASRKAGMAEVASDVLHHIGNTLNSVNVSRQIIVKGIKEMDITSLAKVADLMLEHTADLGTSSLPTKRDASCPPTYRY